MTASAASEQIDPERKRWKRGREDEREREKAGGVWHYSITIRAVLDFPTFQNKETNFSQSPSGSQRKNHISFFPDSPEARNPLPAPPPFQRVLYITPSTVEFYYLSYAFLNTKLKLQKRRIIFFYCIFLQVKKNKALCGVCICTIIICIVLLYYPSIIMIMVKNVNVITVKDDCFSPCSKWTVSNLVDLLQSRCNGY